MRVSVKTSSAVLALIACLALNAQAQILVGPSGVGPIDFSTTPPPSEWATLDITTGSASTYESPAALDAGAQTLDQSTITTQLPTIGAIGTARLARHNTNAQYLFTQPTGVPAAVLKATLRNNSGGPISGITVSYNYIVALAGVTDAVPGQRVYYSTNGLPNTWTLLPAFSGLTASAAVSAGIPLETWVDGSDIYLLWLDDNNLTGNDGSFAIDNFAVAIGLPPCPGITNNPQSLTVTQCVVNSVSFSLGVTGAVSGVQWYRDTGSGFTAIPGANSLTYTLTPVAVADSGSLFQAVITGSGTCASTSTVASLTVISDTFPPVPLYAFVSSGNTNITVVFNEPINTNDPAPIDVTGNYALVDTNTSSFITILDAIPLANSRGYVLVTDPIDLSHGFTLDLSSTKDACADNLMEFTTIPVNSFVSQPLGLHATWRYLDNDIDPAANWFQSGFDDSGWLSAPGPFDAKRNAGGPAINCRPPGTMNLYFTNDTGGAAVPHSCLLLTSPVTGTNLVTAYFRTTFNYSGDTNATLLELQSKYDDGAVIYLNGVELMRIGLPAAPAVITDATFATRTVGDAEQLDISRFYNAPSLKEGQNLLAIELHQQSLTSSDLTMGVKVLAYTTEQLCAAGPLSISYSGGNVTITWSGGAVLQQSTDISSPANWTNVSGSPTSPYTTAATGPAKFYRVVCP